MKTLCRFLAQAIAVLIAAQVNAATITLIDNTTPGYYNGSISNLLDGTSAAFPTNTDPDLHFTNAPDLSAAQSVLGNWLASPPELLPPFWSQMPTQIFSQWPGGTETAIVYPLDVPAGGYTNLLLQFGADNGIFVWLDGQYLGGRIKPGFAFLGEDQYVVASLSAGPHHLQVLREDHGAPDDYLVQVTAEDTTTVTLSIGDVVVEEPDFGQINYATFLVTLDRPSDQEIEVDFVTADITAIAGVDYLSNNTGILLFDPGEIIQSITVPVYGDNVCEPTETFKILITAITSGVNLRVNQAIGTIVD